MNSEIHLEVAEAVVDAMVREMTIDEMRNAVWDQLYDELIHQSWSDLRMHAEHYVPELLDELEGG